MEEETEERIKWFILHKMTRHRFWMGKHTSIHNLPKGLPEHARGIKETKNVIHNLLKDRILLSKSTNYGLEVSLNIKRKKDIEDFIEKNRSKFDKQF